jgi:hypothetical protein
MGGFGGHFIGGNRIEETVSEALASRPEAFTTAPPVNVRPVVVADNSKFIDRVKTSDLVDILVRPTKTIVVSQSPGAGEQVPLGTQITLTLTVKDVLPLGPLGVSPALAQKFATAGAFREAVDGAGDPDALKQALAGTTRYQDLQGTEKQAADDFLGQLGALSDQDKAAAFDDAGFVFNL